MKTYTIEQIQEYLAGHLSVSANPTCAGTLHNALVMIEDGQSGIEAVIENTNGTPCFKSWKASQSE